MTSKSLYTKTSLELEGQLLSGMFAHSPQSYASYGAFSKQVFKQGKLSLYTKELIAVAAAHITGCPYCIDIHVAKAKKQEASLEELLEAVTVAAAVNSYAVFASGANTIRAYEDATETTDLFSKSNIALLQQWEMINERTYDSVFEYVHTATEEERVSSKDKALIAVGCAQVLGNPYAIEYFTRFSKDKGITLEEIAETSLIAIALKAGAALAHSLNTLHAYESE
jgi:AhpD family alkylhydroperoxidase